MLCGAANIVMKDMRKLAAEKNIGSRSITDRAADTEKPYTDDRPDKVPLVQCEAACFDKAPLQMGLNELLHHLRRWRCGCCQFARQQPEQQIQQHQTSSLHCRFSSSLPRTSTATTAPSGLPLPCDPTPT